MKRDRRFHDWSKTARIDKHKVHKVSHYVRIEGVWCGFASKRMADIKRESPRAPITIYARGISLSAIRELIERNK